MWVLPHYANEKLANALNSRMRAKNSAASIATSLYNNDTRSRMLLRPNLEVVNYFLKNYTMDGAIAKYDTVITSYMQPTNVTFRQYANDLVYRSCSAAGVYSERILDDVFIEDLDVFMHHNVRHYWAQKPEGDLTDIAFKAKSLQNN